LAPVARTVAIALRILTIRSAPLVPKGELDDARRPPDGPIDAHFSRFEPPYLLESSQTKRASHPVLRNMNRSSGRDEGSDIQGRRVAGLPAGKGVDAVNLYEPPVFPEGPGGLVWRVARGAVQRLDFDNGDALKSQGAKYGVKQERAVPGVASIWTDGHPENLRRTRRAPLRDEKPDEPFCLQDDPSGVALQIAENAVLDVLGEEVG
jgi:hypothetical protein